MNIHALSNHTSLQTNLAFGKQRKKSYTGYLEGIKRYMGKNNLQHLYILDPKTKEPLRSIYLCDDGFIYTEKHKNIDNPDKEPDFYFDTKGNLVNWDSVNNDSKSRLKPSEEADKKAAVLFSRLAWAIHNGLAVKASTDITQLKKGAVIKSEIGIEMRVKDCRPMGDRYLIIGTLRNKGRDTHIEIPLSSPWKSQNGKIILPNLDLVK